MSRSSDNRSITPDARAFVEELARFVARPEVTHALADADRIARATLAREPDVDSVFQPIDLAAFDAPVASARLVVTRGSGSARIERHPNSTQYLFALDGAVETRIRDGDDWRVDRYGGGPAVALEDRWHVVPNGTWHRSNAPEDRDWAIASFHTARVVADEYRDD